MILRPYQTECVDRVRELVASGVRKVVLQAPTGSGKTVTAAKFIQNCVDKGKRCLFLAPGRELIDQCSDKLHRFGVEHGIIMSGRPYDLTKPVQVATKQTLISRAFVMKKRLAKALENLDETKDTMEGGGDLWTEVERLKKYIIDLPEFDLIIPDECHLSMSPLWLLILNLWPKAVVVGLSATPIRANGMQLGNFYKGLVQSVMPSQLISEGFLVPTRVYAPYKPDLKGLRVNKSGEYEKAVERRLDKPKLVGDIVEHWKKLASERLTIVFASGVSHSQHIRDQFLSDGIVAEHLDGKTPTDERDAMLKRFANGETRVLVNCNVLTQGWDCPQASCCILAKPTMSYVAYRQMAGRIQRPFEGKKDALLIDHAGCVYVHLLPDADMDWKLEEGEKINDRIKEQSQNGKAVTHCPKCHAMYSGTNVCPACGHTVSKPIKKTPQQDGQLVEVTELGAAVASEMAVRKWHKYLAIAANRGHTPGAAAAMFKRDTGMLPWEIDGLPNMPNRMQWKTPVGELYPQYLRRRTL